MPPPLALLPLRPRSWLSPALLPSSHQKDTPALFLTLFPPSTGMRPSGASPLAGIRSNPRRPCLLSGPSPSNPLLHHPQPKPPFVPQPRLLPLVMALPLVLPPTYPSLALFLLRVLRESQALSPISPPPSTCTRPLAPSPSISRQPK